MPGEESAQRKRRRSVAIIVYGFVAFAERIFRFAQVAVTWRYGGISGASILPVAPLSSPVAFPVYVGIWGKK